MDCEQCVKSPSALCGNGRAVKKDAVGPLDGSTKGLKEVLKVMQEAHTAVYAAARQKAVGKVDTKLKAVGVMLADLATPSEMWREVRSKLHRMIEGGDLTMVQVQVLEIAYGQVEIARAEVDVQERAGKELVKEHEAAQEQAKPRRFTNYGDVKIPFGGPGAGIILEQGTNLPRLCTRFHARPKTKCTAGVRPGHPSGKVGQCIFAH